MKFLAYGLDSQWLGSIPSPSGNAGHSQRWAEAGSWTDISTYAGWWFQTFFIFHFIYGLSSFPLTKSIIFQDGEIAPPTSMILTYCRAQLGGKRTWQSAFPIFSPNAWPWESAVFWSLVYPLVNGYITNWRITIFNGKTHYFNGHVQVRKLFVITRG